MKLKKCYWLFLQLHKGALLFRECIVNFNKPSRISISFAHTWVSEVFECFMVIFKGKGRYTGQREGRWWILHGYLGLDRLLLRPGASMWRSLGGKKITSVFWWGKRQRVSQIYGTVNRISKKSTFMSKKFDFTHNVRGFLQKFVKTFYLDRDLSCLIRSYCVHEIRWFQFCNLTFLLFFGHVWSMCYNIIRFEMVLIGTE